jgi:hypothetical protein
MTMGTVSLLAEKDNRHHRAEQRRGGAYRIGDRYAESVDAFISEQTG